MSIPLATEPNADEEHTYGVETDRDQLEIDLLRAADRLRLPTLAICRGMQIMNVAFGGTLHQHLPDMPGMLEHGVPDRRHDLDARRETGTGQPAPGDVEVDVALVLLPPSSRHRPARGRARRDGMER